MYRTDKKYNHTQVKKNTALLFGLFGKKYKQIIILSEIYNNL